MDLNNIELLVLDVDGTILDEKGELSPEVGSFLRKISRNGFQIALATGRSLNRTLYIALEIDSRMPLILLNGAWVHHLALGQDWRALNLPRQSAIEAIHLLRKWNFDIILQKGIPDSHLFFYERENEDNIEFTGRIQRNFERCTKIPDLTALLQTEDPGEITLLDTTDKILEVKEKLARTGLDIGLAYSTSFINQGFSWLEILHRDATKGKALEFLAGKLGIDRAHIAAVGDNFNDIDMLEYAGLGIAIGSAEPGVKNIADIILPDDGKGILGLQSYLGLFSK